MTSPGRRRGLSLRAKILSGHLGLVALAFLVLAFVYVQMAETDRDLAVVRQGYFQLWQDVAAVNAFPLGYELDKEAPDWRRYRPALDGLYLDQKRRLLEDAGRRARDVHAVLRDPSARLALGPVLVGVDQALSDLDRYARDQEALARAVGARDYAAANTLVPGLKGRRDALGREIDQLLKALRQRVEDGLADASAAHRETTRVAGALAGLSLLFGALMMLLAHLTLKPVARLAEGVEQVARGEFDLRLDIRTSDEIGVLAGRFEEMARSLKAREESLIQAERLAAIGRMSAQVTHEIRNPLNALGLNVEVLADELEGLDAGPEAREVLASIRREIDRLNGVAETYLTLARLPRPRLQPEDVRDLVASLVDFHHDEWEAMGVKVEVAVPPGLPRVRADAGQLRQALLNLVRNAAEALAPAGGGTVRLDAAAADGRVRLRVADDGPGIDPERLQRIFDPFYSTKTGGTGLGLPITHQIVVEHRGEVRCESAPDRGTTFTVELPVA